MFSCATVTTLPWLPCWPHRIQIPLPSLPNCGESMLNILNQPHCPLRLVSSMSLPPKLHAYSSLFVLASLMLLLMGNYLSPRPTSLQPIQSLPFLRRVPKRISPGVPQWLNSHSCVWSHIIIMISFSYTLQSVSLKQFIGSLYNIETGYKYYS